MAVQALGGCGQRNQGRHRALSTKLGRARPAPFSRPGAAAGFRAKYPGWFGGSQWQPKQTGGTIFETRGCCILMDTEDVPNPARGMFPRGIFRAAGACLSVDSSVLYDEADRGTGTRWVEGHAGGGSCTWLRRGTTVLSTTRTPDGFYKWFVRRFR